MKTVLIIQGEGRGHISQAISYCERYSDLDITKIFISNQREIPKSFLEHFKDAQIEMVDSLNFKYKNGKVHFFNTFFHNMIMFPKFIKSLFNIRKQLKIIKPEQVINFYEPLSIAVGHKYKKISISNQYLFNHKGWKYPNKNLNYYIIKLWNKITSYGSNELIAPSFMDLKSNKHVKVIQPLIRDSLRNKKVTEKDYTLVYFIDKYLTQEFIKCVFKDEKYLLFCDKSFIEDIELPTNIEYFELNTKTFTDKLLTCKKVISTGGFQLISECVFLGKKITIIPLHYEQEINAYNLELNGLGELFYFL